MTENTLKQACMPLVCALMAVLPCAAATMPAKEQPLRFMHKVDTAKLPFSAEAVAGRIKAPKANELPAASNIDFLQGPDGNIWFAVSKYETKRVPLEGGYAYDDQILAYEITVYNNLFEEVGSVKDVVVFEENETRVAAVAPDMSVTQKFFNSDSNYELIVSLVLNRVDYSTRQYSKVYSIGGTKDDAGNDIALATYDGYVVAAENYASSSSSEEFVLTFIREEAPSEDDFDFENKTYVDFLNEYKLHLDTYKRASWGGQPEMVDTYTLQQVCIPGDTMDGVFFFLTKTDNGRPALVYSQYEKPYFVDPTGFATDESATPDNNLLIEVRTMASASAPSAETLCKTSIPMDMPEADMIGLYYSIGALRYSDDVEFVAGQPVYTVAIERQYAADMDNIISSYYGYDKDGKRTHIIAENVDAFVGLSDIKGEDPVVLFPELKGAEYIFNFVNIRTGETILSLPQMLEGCSLTARMDRVSLKGNIYYVFNLGTVGTDSEGNDLEYVAWVGADGSVVRVDELNLGKNVTFAYPYIDSTALTPYMFDTDDDMEYMFLVKRSSGDLIKEELVIVDAVQGELLHEKEDADKGSLLTISLVNQSTTPSLVVIRYGDNGYSTDVYSLPLTSFKGGDGSEANPYLVATIADMQQMQNNLQAHYRFVADVDATGFLFKPINNFSGTIDGAGHKVYNFSLEKAYTRGLISNGNNCTVTDLTFIAPVIDLGSSQNYVGLVAGSAFGSVFRNIHIYDLSAVCSDSSNAYDGSFGGIVGNATNGTEVSSCHVTGVIDAPEALVGGIVGQARTAAVIKACAFVGTIDGGNEVGGIVGETQKDITVSDCHVDADITAANTVGGIVGEAGRGVITRCFVEGTVTATTPDKWSKTVVAGGIAGSFESLPSDFDANGNPVPPTDVPVLVTKNVVALEAINAPAVTETPAYAQQFNTVHRIVGRTSFNDEPRATGYDSEWNPIYPENFTPIDDAGIAGNHAVSTLAVVSESMGAGLDNAEGASVEPGDLKRSFYEGLDFAYGTATDAPWHAASDAAPRLHFEQSIYLPEAVYAVREGEKFFVTVKLMSRKDVTLDELEDAGFESTVDSDNVEQGDYMSMDDNTLTVEFVAALPGTANITFTYNGCTATAKVTVEEVAGIADIAAASAPVISFDGSVVAADGSTIELYSLAGVKVAAAASSLSVENIPAGIYIVRATAADGTSASRKLAL